MLGGIPRRWVHVCIAKHNLLDISEIYVAGSAFTNHLRASLCILNEVVEDRRFLRVVSRGSYRVVQVQKIYFYIHAQAILEFLISETKT